jgi:hypothetical protein
VVDNDVERQRWYWGMRGGMRIFRDLWLEERGSVIWRSGGESVGPKRRKAAWGVHEPQILPRSHNRTSPLHLQLGRAVSMDPVLTVPSLTHKAVKVATSTLKV